MCTMVIKGVKCLMPMISNLQFRVPGLHPKYLVSITNLNGSEPIFKEGKNNLEH